LADEDLEETKTETETETESNNQVPVTVGEAMVQIDSASVLGVNIDVVAVLGVAELKVSQILQLGRGAVVELERALEDPIELIAEGRVVAVGEVVVVDEMLAVQITKVTNRD
jgi:flagellar motor switch protein FliN